MTNLYETLQNRGYIAQATHETEIKDILNNKKISFYIGFDPTADSLHVGHFLQLMVMSHMQKAGHKPIVLIGGGTTMVGDPSGRTDMRKILSIEEIKSNGNRFKEQITRFISFDNDRALMVNNADWLLDLNYVNFLRDYGAQFSVNRMLTADAYKSRLEEGLTFLEFNYMIMQAYDFLELNNRLGCTMQMGGRDQWSNIIAGVDLIRRVKSQEVYGLTFNLLTTSAGEKMGKTAKGALWLDKDKTSPYEFYQYFINIDDAGVVNCLKLLTYVDLQEIEALGKLKGQDINKAKSILAYEVTKLVHGENHAQEARQAAQNLFSKNGRDASGEISMPMATFPKDEFEKGMEILMLLEKIKFASSKTEGRRLISQGGIKINDEKIESSEHVVRARDFEEGYFVIQRGKKVVCKVVIE